MVEWFNGLKMWVYVYFKLMIEANDDLATRAARSRHSYYSMVLWCEHIKLMIEANDDLAARASRHGWMIQGSYDVSIF